MSWVVSKLKDLPIEIIDGDRSAKYPKREEFQAEGIAFLNSTNISGNTLDLGEVHFISEEKFAQIRKGRIRGGDILMTTRGSIGKVAWVPHGFQGLINAQMLILRADSAEVDGRFLFSVLSSPETQQNLKNFASGSAQPQIPIRDLREIEVRMPRIAAQRRIASILSAFDDLIENNTRRIAILEEMARRIYEEWFVRFRFPGHESVRMVESELGLVPEGWSVGTVTDVAVVYRGRSYKGSELADSGGRPFVNLKCMDRDGGFRASGLKRYTGEFKDSQTVRPGDMVMGITDMTQERRIVARVGRVSGLDADFGVFSMDLVRIASRGEYAEPYLYAMFRWSGFADEVKQHANGANVLHLLPARIEEFAFARPTPELAAKFADLFAPMLSLCDKLEQKNANLRATRDLLLPKLISGELDVSAMPEPETVAA